MIDRNDGGWWRDAVFYQIYPRSFKDSDGDGTGDLRGIEESLGYLSWLGVDALWISPFFKSPMRDFGYDVSDYRDVDPLFGDIAAFRSLLDAAHAKGIRIVIDLVVNHSSEEHPWFAAARSSKDDPKHPWYIWKPIAGRRPPNNWISLFEQRSAWYPNEATGEWYLATFTRHQPEFDWRNPELREAIHDIVRFWLDFGVDGFRLDVATAYFKDEAFRSNPWSARVVPDLCQKHLYDRNRPEVHEEFRRLREIADSYGDRVLIGETHGTDPALAASCHGDRNDELHMAFNFDFLFRPWGAASFRDGAEGWYRLLPPGAWPNFTLSNHDQRRHAGRFGRGAVAEARAGVAAAMLLCLRGTPFLYYGEELGMGNARIPKAAVRDPLGLSTWPLPFGRDPERTPMQWDGSPNAGFSAAAPWLPVNRDYPRRNIESQRADPESLLSWYRELIALRKAEPALRSGNLEWLDAPRGVMAWERSSKGRRVRVYLNFSRRAATVDVAAGRIVASRVLESDVAGSSLARGAALDSGPRRLPGYSVLVVADSRA